MSTSKENTLPSVTYKGNIALVEKLYISELGYLMVKLYIPSKRIWVRCNVGLEGNNEILNIIQSKI